MDDGGDGYRIEDQIGYILRQANQRHLAIFSRHITDYTPTQLSAMARLFERGQLSQNELGRQTSMDAATIKGVVDRLRRRGLVTVSQDANDLRRSNLSLSETGRAEFLRLRPVAARITAETVAGLDDGERAALTSLLRRLGAGAEG
jgi:DNA-binding MarR family transcriptional regulator